MAIIRHVRRDDHKEWLRMRVALWPEFPIEELAAQVSGWNEHGDTAVFVAQRPNDGLCGFVEAAIRPCTVNGELGRIGYIEGWFVDPDVRCLGVGRLLVIAAEQWAREKQCEEMHSDTYLANELSQTAHRRLGYTEVDRLVHFRKRLV